MSKNKEIELKPCPFCDAEAHVHMNESDCLYGFYVAACSDCDATMIVSPDKADTIAAWNQRAPSKQNKELLDVLENIISMNRITALEQYDDPKIAEKWACVKAARKAIKENKQDE